mmetsp:Transcript_14245/g.21974  ORF Transcript_14245/g.21974 Transcript_14245/m.21974 type:complete len:184 (-) Transcript_14245:80-631(-)
MEASNDGGIVLSLFLMVAAIAYALLNAIVVYERSTGIAINTKTDYYHRLLRLLSGWANLGNSVVHILLIVYTLAHKGNDSDYWIEERKLGGIEGPVGLTVLNFLVGLSALRGYSMMFSIGWNSFVALAGTLLPVVWPRFVEEGLAAWPYSVIFIWFAIFAFELTAVTCSLIHLALGNTKRKSE